MPATRPASLSCESLQAILPKERISIGHPLAGLTSSKCQGVAEAFAKIHTAEELAKLAMTACREGWPFLVLGKGSNTIFADDYFSGVIGVLAGDFKSVRLASADVVWAGAALSTEKLAAFARRQGLSGAEFMATVPGTVGGALFMNAGAHGTETKDILVSAEFLDKEGVIVSRTKDKLGFGYRSSCFQSHGGIITGAEFKLCPSEPKRILAKEQELKRQRKKTQPISKPTWGSVFKNPAGNSAGSLIEQCGLKGKGVGQACISPMHANFIENTGQATGHDMLATLGMARDAVQEKFGITLQTEVRIITGSGETLDIDKPT